MDEFLSEFLTETTESLSLLDTELVDFEQNPENAETLQDIFRLVHTIKGTCGFLDLSRLEAVAHSAENVLGKFRDGSLEVTPDSVSVILNSIDRIKELLSALEETGTEPKGEDSDLISLLAAVVDGNPSAAASDKKAGGQSAEAPELSEGGFPVAAELLAEVAAAEAAGFKAPSETEILAGMEAEEGDEGQQPAAIAKSASKVQAKKEDGESPRESSVAAQSIRVSVGLLENLMTLVSELVLTRNQLLQMVRGHDDSEFKVPLQRLSLITSDLQEGVMKTRMQPIGNAWSKLPRIVRDLATESGKKIDLQMLGAETELDRQVLELIKDPLTHMVRNSADHGLEGLEERSRIGKPKAGVIRLNAYHEGGHIIIEISDDGRGLNIEKIKAKAIANGLASEADINSMSVQQIQQFIMRPGFSTAEKVTSVSGRGVGMDVVRANIEKIGGTIEFNSRAGEGSSFTIKIPLTLAIVSALIVECAGERFAVPQLSVLELVHASSNSESSIEMINEAPVLRLRDRLLPLVVLEDALKLRPENAGSRRRLVDEEKFVVVCQVGANRFGVIVDRVFDTEEIVVKPVAPILRDIPMFSGNTILGDGSVIMILDPNGISSAAGSIAAAQESIVEQKSKHMDFSKEKTSLLVFRAGSKELKAVPLALVARLEEIVRSSVEHSHGVPMVQYRGHIMPLVPFNQNHTWSKEGRQPTIVFTEGKRSMGLVVDEIVDIVEDQVSVELKADQAGIIGTALVAGKATDVIDTSYYLTLAFSDWFGEVDNKGLLKGGGSHRGCRLLLVDDSSFFRNLMKPQLSAAGYEVATVESAAAALKLRDGGVEFDAIVSDIEMPGMDGFAFARELRGKGAWADLPIIALSVHSSDQIAEKGTKAGFNEFVAKFNRDMLIEKVNKAISGRVRNGKVGA